MLNLTAVATTSRGYFTLYPNGVARPTASSINFPKGWTGANMVTVPVGADGKVALYNYGAAAHAVIDVLGWYWQDSEQPLGSQFLPIGEAERVFDSRSDGGPLEGGDYVDLSGLIMGAPTDTSEVAQLVVNITAVGATKPGVLTAWSGEGTRPKASTVNYEPKVIAPNMAVVTAGHGAGGAGLRISNTSSGSVHVVVDLVGVQFADSPIGLRFTPRAAPTRLLDTRKAVGLSGAFGPGQTRTVNGSSVSGPTPSGSSRTPRDHAHQADLPQHVERRVRARRAPSEPAQRQPRAGAVGLDLRDDHRHAPLQAYNNAGSMHVAMDVAGTLDFYPDCDAMGPLVARGARTPRMPRAPTVRGLDGQVRRPTVAVRESDGHRHPPVTLVPEGPRYASPVCRAVRARTDLS